MEIVVLIYQYTSCVELTEITLRIKLKELCL